MAMPHATPPTKLHGQCFMGNAAELQGGMKSCPCEPTHLHKPWKARSIANDLPAGLKQLSGTVYQLPCGKEPA